MLFILWCSGVMAFGLGGLLAQINGYPWQPVKSLLLALGTAVLQALVLVWLTRGRTLAGGLALGLLPLYLGFYAQSGHWVSEVWILGLMLSLAAGNALLTHRWHREGVNRPSAAAPLPAGRTIQALGLTLSHILLIAGLVLIWYFPANPLPGRDGAWLLAAGALASQELVKRKYYAQPRGSRILAWSAAGFSLALSLWLLFVFLGRLRSQ
jgi:hypothetical protein